MILVISNICAYSFMGDYKTSSHAITVNKNYERKCVEEKTRFYLPAVACFATAAIVLSVALVVCLIENNINIAQGDIQNQKIGNMTNLMNTFEENYRKHDFSEFDN